MLITRFRPRSALSLLCLALAGLSPEANLAQAQADPASPVPGPADGRPKKIYGHYMGCFPAGYGPIVEARKAEAGLRHDAPQADHAAGGRFKTWPLVPRGAKLTPQQSADLEIRRGLRSGLDGFAIDAWAGGKTARDTLDALFAAAEAADLPFEITICLDPSCLPPGEDGYLSAIRYLLDNHGGSPKLARRNGKPLIFGYSSEGLLRSQRPLDSEAKWLALAKAYASLEAKVGQPLFFHLGVEHFTSDVDFRKTGMSGEEMMIRLTGVLGREAGAIGLFLDYQFAPFVAKLSAAARDSGAEWAPPVTVQYDNVLGSLHAPAGTAALRDGWQRAHRDNATLIQFATWNDYGEHSSLAPTQATGYGFGLLNGYFAQTWKTGRPPEVTRDQVYVTYRKHLRNAKKFPFPSHRGAPDILEVLTLLPRPATVRLPGRQVEYEAPAGLFVKQIPLAPGPVKVEVLRAGRAETVLNAPEPVTDRPFREDNTLVGASTEDRLVWRQEFPGAPYPEETEYGDDDGDGLPNWFEMYWLGKMGDFATATAADPAADPDGDGKSNLEEYLEQTDPTRKPPEYKAGFTWDLFDVIRGNASFNPDRDRAGTPVWSYRWRTLRPESGFSPLPKKWNQAKAVIHASDGGSITWKKEDKKEPSPTSLQFGARTGHEVALVWQSPVDGIVDLAWRVSSVKTGDGLSLSVRHSSGDQYLWKQEFKDGEQTRAALTGIKVAPGDRLLFVQSSEPKTDAYERLSLDSLTISLAKTEGAPTALP